MKLPSCLVPKSKYSTGILFILVVNVTWSLTSLLVQLLYTRSSFSSPFYLTYICTCLFVVLLRPTDFRHFFSRPPKEFAIAVPLAPLWFSANFLYYVSLKYTSITSSTVLSTLGGVFCYVLEYLVLPARWFPSGEKGRREGRTRTKFAGVFICFACSAFIGYFDGKDAGTTDGDSSGTDDDSTGPSGTRPVLGDVAGLLSAVMYAT